MARHGAACFSLKICFSAGIQAVPALTLPVRTNTDSSLGSGATPALLDVVVLVDQLLCVAPVFQLDYLVGKVSPVRAGRCGDQRKSGFRYRLTVLGDVVPQHGASLPDHLTPDCYSCSSCRLWDQQMVCDKSVLYSSKK